MGRGECWDHSLGDRAVCLEHHVFCLASTTPACSAPNCLHQQLEILEILMEMASLVAYKVKYINILSVLKCSLEEIPFLNKLALGTLFLSSLSVNSYNCSSIKCFTLHNLSYA